MCPSASLFFGSQPSGKRSSASQHRRSLTLPPKIEYISAPFPEPRDGKKKARRSQQKGRGKARIRKEEGGSGLTKELVQEAPGQGVLAVAASALGAAESGVVDDVVERQMFAVRRLREVSVDEVGVREALVGAEGDVGACVCVCQVSAQPCGPV